MGSTAATSSGGSREPDRGASPDELLVDVDRGLNAGEFEAFLQPFIHVPTNSVIGGELLVRWRHPSRGVLAPGAFLGAIEECGRLRDVTDLMLDVACSLGSGGRLLSLNLAHDDLDDPALLGRVRAALDAHGADETRLCLEVVETTLVDGSDARLHELNEWGVQIAVDDFGAEYSSLARVLDLQVDLVKLDRSLIKRLHERRRTQVVLRGLIESLHELGTVVAAEGIEEPGELDVLADLDIDIVQGYLFARPAPAGELAAVFQNSAVLSAGLVGFDEG